MEVRRAPVKGHAPFAGAGLVGGMGFEFKDCEGEAILYAVRNIERGMQ